MALSANEREEMSKARKAELDSRVQSSLSQLSDETRMCARCGWKIRKSEAIARGIKTCPRCGGDRIVAQSMDFNLTPDSVRQTPIEGGR